MVVNTNRYIHERDERGGITASVLTAGPDFDKLKNYHSFAGVEHYTDAGGCGWRICQVLDPVSREMIEGFEILPLPTTTVQ